MKISWLWSCLFLVASLLVGCMSREERILRGIMRDYSLSARQTAGLYQASIGGGVGPGETAFYATMLSGESDMTIPEARELIVEQTELLRAKMWATPQFARYLEPDPLCGQLELVILFLWDKAGESSVNNLAGVFVCEGMVHYEGFDSKKKYFYGLHRESYQEAVDCVKNPPEEEILDTPSRDIKLPETAAEKTARLIRGHMDSLHRFLRNGCIVL